MKVDLPLACPCQKKSKLKRTATGYTCCDPVCQHSAQENEFPVVNKIPVLVSEIKCDTVCVLKPAQTYVTRVRGFSRTRKLLAGSSKTTQENCKIFVDELLSKTGRPKVLVIGSGERGGGTEDLWANTNIEIHGIDIYGSDSVDVICDAHYLPLESSSYDGVWIQAVLEHVVEPKVVVDEIFRVLKVNGLVYAETPFMQQVHEGAYDFTRFTVLGNRYLFKQFEAIRFGGNKGPEVVFAWATRYLVWSITRSRRIGRLFGLGVGLLMRLLEPLISKESMYDASSGVYFLGRKLIQHNVTHKELVNLYRGQFKSSVI